MAGAEIVPPNSLSVRNEKSSMVLFFWVSLTCVVTSDHKQKKGLPHVSPSIACRAGNGCAATSGGGVGGEWGGDGGRNDGGNQGSSWGIQQSTENQQR